MKVIKTRSIVIRDETEYTTMKEWGAERMMKGIHWSSISSGALISDADTVWADRQRVVAFSLEYIMAEATQEESADTPAAQTTCDRRLLAELAALRARSPFQACAWPEWMWSNSETEDIKDVFRQAKNKKHGRQNPLRHNSVLGVFCLNFCRTDVTNISVRLHCCVLKTALYHHFCCPHRRHDEGGRITAATIALHMKSWHGSNCYAPTLTSLPKANPLSFWFIFSPIATHPHLHRLVWFLKVLFLVY